jgi:sortase A
MIRSSAMLPRLEGFAWVMGILLLGACMLVELRAHAFSQASQNLAAAARGVTGPGAAAPLATRPLAAKGSGAAGDQIIGHLEIPSLSLSVAILAGYESSTLLKGVGHIQGTALPGGLGTVGLVGHRDTFFRPLRHVAPGMEIELSDGSGTYRYAVDSTEIVTPDQVSVLDIGNRPSMVLVTCYPFDFVGAAPKRFVVHAHLLSLVPEKKQPNS